MPVQVAGGQKVLVKVTMETEKEVLVIVVEATRIVEVDPALVTVAVWPAFVTVIVLPAKVVVDTGPDTVAVLVEPALVTVADNEIEPGSVIVAEVIEVHEFASVTVTV